MVRLGIDFGTTRTVVAAAIDGRYPIANFAVEDGYRAWMPTMAARTDAGWVYGEAAAGHLRSPTGVGIRSIKRLLSDPSAAHELAADPLELATGFLNHLRETLIADANLEVQPGERLETMVAVPANAGSHQRFLTLEAFHRAGFEVLGMVNEPSAAAIEFAHRDLRVISPRSPKRYVVVYDLGGGTFDTSAVSLEGRRFELLASEGIQQLGGDDFDERILALWRAQLGHEGELPVATRTSLLETCRRAKESLTPQSRKLLLEAEPGIALDAVTLEAKDIYGACEDLVQRTLSLVDNVFDSLPDHIEREDARQLGAIYLVGGAVAFPAVTKALRQVHERKVKLTPDPHAATAIGLAVAADPGNRVEINEATTRYFGVWRETEGGHGTVFDPLLRKDELPQGDAPLVIERHYRPAHSVGHLRFVECTRLEAGRPAGDLAPYGELYFPYDPELAEESNLATLPVSRNESLGDQEIVERYVYGRDGTIAVHVENRSRGYARDLRLVE